MISFNPTSVPKGTLKALAKRLGSHPTLAKATTSQRQEIIARTFGHSSWHALCRATQPRIDMIAADPRQRARLYFWLGECLKARIDIALATRLIARTTEKWGDPELRDLALSLLEKMKEGRKASEAFDEVIGPHAPMESFVIGAGEPLGKLQSAFDEAHRMAQDQLETMSQGARA